MTYCLRTGTTDVAVKVMGRNVRRPRKKDIEGADMTCCGRLYQQQQQGRPDRLYTKTYPHLALNH